MHAAFLQNAARLRKLAADNDGTALREAEVSGMSAADVLRRVKGLKGSFARFAREHMASLLDG